MQKVSKGIQRTEAIPPVEWSRTPNQALTRPNSSSKLMVYLGVYPSTGCTSKCGPRFGPSLRRDLGRRHSHPAERS